MPAAHFPTKDIVEDFRSCLILVIRQENFVSALAKIVRSSAGSSLQRCNGIFLLLPAFCPRVRFVLKGQKETAGDCLPGTQLIDEPEIILLKGTASRIRLL